LSKLATGYLTGTYVSKIDGSPQPFAVWAPRSYSARKKYPLLVVLHGSDADERMIPEKCLRIPEKGFREDMILLSPFGRGEVGFRWMGEADLWDAMSWVKARYRVDERRQYLSGLSMGGFATWRLGSAYPEQWAAIAPVCGGGALSLLPRLADTPVWCVHGEADDIVPVENSRALAAGLSRLGGRCRYTELKGWGHKAWEWLYDPARADGGLAGWLLEHQLGSNPPPQRRPKREGGFMDLFGEPLIISYATGTSLGRELETLEREAGRLGVFTHGDIAMRSGRLLVKPDTEVSIEDLARCNHLMIGRTDNHFWMKAAARKLTVRHRKGILTVGDETWLGKSLLVLACQPSPWKPRRLLGTVTYQQFHQLRHLLNAVLDAPLGLRQTNVYDAQQKRFIHRGT
jgi:pimeloyl-ACP methyl ester carboxylesterase